MGIARFDTQAKALFRSLTCALGATCCFRLARTAVAACLLIAGTQWLARTSSISDLILNAVALEAILQIDELIFVALYPKKVQTAIYELEPVKIRYTRRSGQLESCLMLFLLATAVSVPFFLWVKTDYRHDAGCESRVLRGRSRLCSEFEPGPVAVGLVSIHYTQYTLPMFSSH